MKKSVFNESTKNRAALMFSSEDARNRSINSPLGFVGLDTLRSTIPQQSASEQLIAPETMSFQDASRTATNMAKYNAMSNVTDPSKAYTGLKSTGFEDTKAGDYNRYGRQAVFSNISDTSGKIGVFGGVPVEGFTGFDYKAKDNTLRFIKPASFYADSLRKQTQIASANPYTTGYNPGSSVMGGVAGINRAMTLSGLDPNAIANRYDAIGNSGKDRFSGLNPNGVFTTDSLFGTQDYNAFNY